MELMNHQLEAVDILRSGNILAGGVGSGKSATVLAYYMKHEAPRHIYVITTAKKRDSLDWEGEAAKFGIGTEDYGTVAGIITVDSWNNLRNYTNVEDAFFIFDEQRVVGYGAWVKGFLQVTKKNHWVLLSATPGDTWLDYAPVFIANGFYKHITDFKQKHVLYEPYLKFPKVKMYLNERKLEALRNDVVVEMSYLTEAERFVNFIDMGYDKEKMKRVYADRWNVRYQRPLKDVAEMFRVMRWVVNSDPSRLEMIRYLMQIHPRLVVFYNFDYELDILRTLEDEIEVLEWNGHQKDELPISDKCDNDRWVYLVQYLSGSEGWNCTSTDGMVLYSLTYSYKNYVQAQGRIDRLDSEYSSLYYYVFVSNSKIDQAIKNALTSKKSFNERKFIAKLSRSEQVLADF
jgi:hypothetical protein